MKIKYPLYLCCILFILASCKKDNNGNNGTFPVKANSILRLDNVLQSNMVIQRNKPLVLWGVATPLSTITVSESWNSGTLQAKTDALGNWRVIQLLCY